MQSCSGMTAAADTAAAAAAAAAAVSSCSDMELDEDYSFGKAIGKDYH